MFSPHSSAAPLPTRRHAADAWRRPFVMLMLVAAAATASQGTPAAGGTIRFFGRVVAPPCTFALGAVQLEPRCHGPAVGDITFADARSHRLLGTAPLVATGTPIALPAQSEQGESVTITVDYR